MTRDEKIKDLEKDIYETKMDLYNIVYRIDNMTESIQHTYLYTNKDELECKIDDLYNDYLILYNQKVLSKKRR